ncbi:unnamed protein product [Pleuronectes platessa]|uniref:Uncharacterized protein n=1 Tax=Pleuronectes platessa TaxID=8262 RepID=A0A9N7U7R8_PLEPL|nr:unnamed protein product [Pleuronectes platessa]
MTSLLVSSICALAVAWLRGVLQSAILTWLLPAATSTMPKSTDGPSYGDERGERRSLTRPATQKYIFVADRLAVSKASAFQLSMGGSLFQYEGQPPGQRLHGCTSDTRPADKGPFIVPFRRSQGLSQRSDAEIGGTRSYNVQGTMYGE